MSNLSPVLLHGMSRENDWAVTRVLQEVRRRTSSLDKYQYLMTILSSDETVFFAALRASIAELMPIVYTPTVGEACLKFSDLSHRPKGLFLGISRKGKIRQELDAYGGNAQVIVVTDGERILGLGDLGANGMGIPAGKLILYTACGGVRPDRCLPVVLDCGCDGKRGEQYIGEDRPRVRGSEYDEFVNEFIEAVVDKWGRNTLIQFEDFGNVNALRLLRKYQNQVCCFNDDIQGTASVALAGIFSALRCRGVPSELASHKFLFFGAGSAGLGIADLIVDDLVVNHGMERAEARRRCWFVDSKGLIYAGRGRITPAKAPYAHEITNEVRNLVVDNDLFAIVKALEPSALVGVSTIPNSFTPEILRFMADTNSRPIVFALSNPTSKSECTAVDAYRYTEGRAIFASGSPFAPVTLPGHEKLFVPGQGNNCYIFPGVGLGAVLSGTRTIPDSMFLVSAKALADLVDQKLLESGCVYPPLESILDCSAHVAYAVCQEASRLGLNDKDVEHLTVARIRKVMYDPETMTE